MSAAADEANELAGKGVSADELAARKVRAKRVKPPTRAEAERAEAWWVKKK